MLSIESLEYLMGAQIPDPPTGYQEPTEHEEASTVKKTFLTLTGISNLLITIMLFAGAASIIPVSLNSVGDVIISISGGSALLQVILIFGGFGILAVGTIVLHEHVHRVVMEYFDYSVEIHYGIPLSYALIEEQMIQRNHNILSLISPLIIISSLSLAGGYLIPNPVLSVIFSAVFLLNTLPSSGDLRGFFILIRKPPETRIWHTHENDQPRSFVYEPE